MGNRSTPCQLGLPHLLPRTSPIPAIIKFQSHNTATLESGEIGATPHGERRMSGASETAFGPARQHLRSQTRALQARVASARRERASRFTHLSRCGARAWPRVHGLENRRHVAAPASGSGERGSVAAARATRAKISAGLASVARWLGTSRALGSSCARPTAREQPPTPVAALPQPAHPPWRVAPWARWPNASARYLAKPPNPRSARLLPWHTCVGTLAWHGCQHQPLSSQPGATKRATFDSLAVLVSTRPPRYPRLLVLVGTDLSIALCIRGMRAQIHGGEGRTVQRNTFGTLLARLREPGGCLPALGGCPAHVRERTCAALNAERLNVFE